MEAVLKDMELDVREIKYLMEILLRQPDSMLRQVTIRRINQMQEHLNVLLQTIDDIQIQDRNKAEEEKEKPTEPLVQKETDNVVIEKTEITALVVPEPEVIIAEPKPEPRKTSTDLTSLLTLNDRFLFSRELFGGDMSRMENVLSQVSEMKSPENAIPYLSTILEFDEENETFHDLVELVRKYFN